MSCQVFLRGTLPSSVRSFATGLREVKATEGLLFRLVFSYAKVCMSFGICDEINGEHVEHMLAVADDERLYKAKNNRFNQAYSLSCSQTH